MKKSALSLAILGLALVGIIHVSAQNELLVIQDLSGNNYSGIAENVTYTDGHTGQALAFSGLESIVTVEDFGQINTAGSITVEAWVFSQRPASNTAPMRIVSKDKTQVKGTLILWETPTSSGDLRPAFFTNQDQSWHKAEAIASIPVQTWTHIAAVYDATSTTTQLYINGQLAASVPGPSALKQTAEKITIGASSNNKHNWIGKIDSVRIHEKALTPAQILDSKENGTVFSDVVVRYDFEDETANTPNLVVWALSDPHIHTDLELNPPVYSLSEALDDAKSFSYDFGVIAGDLAGGQGCPLDPTDGSRELLDQFNRSGVNPNLFYSVIGNHGANQTGGQWFKKWVDPLAGNTAFSGISNKDPVRRETSGYWDHYSFEEGNTLFLMLSDNNFGEPPFGRDCVAEGGYPAGRYSLEQFEWWKNQVEQNQDKIIVTVAHHGLLDTTMLTGLCTAWANGSQGGHTWADRRGGSIIYAIGEETIDGLTSEFVQNNPLDTAQQCFAQPVIQMRDYGFKKYLEDNPGSIDLWLHGHTHFHLHPDFVDADGRGSIAYKHGATFMNIGALTFGHGPAEVRSSRILEFTNGSANLNIKTYLHEAWDTGSEILPKGIRPEFTSVPLKTAFIK